MRPTSIRTSIVLWVAGLSISLLAAFSFLTLRAVRQSLLAGLDADLEARATAVASFCEWEEDLDRVVFDREDGQLALDAAARDGGIEVLLLPGRDILVRAGQALPAAAKEELPDAVTGSAARRFADLDQDGLPLRLLALRLRRAGELDPRTGTAEPSVELLLRVAASTVALEAKMAEIRDRVLALLSLTIAALALFGVFLSRRLTEPLRALERAAAEHGPGRRHAMPRRGNGDEIDRLAGRLDEAFGALNDALDRQARFSANAAHELRNPIAVIRSAAEVALRRDRAAEELRPLLADVATTAARMGEIVDALLGLARIGSGTITDTETVAPGEVLASIRAAAPADEAARIQVEGELQALRGHRGLLAVLIGNLVGNALRHGGRGPVTVATERRGDRVLLSVRDRGEGIAEELRERIFEPFYRARGETSGVDGAGLGLALVAEIARCHGGEVKVEEARPGARFLVDLPAA